MVKQLEQQVVVAGCSVEQFFEIVYGDDEAVKLYHTEYNKTPEVVVGSWENCSRIVQFSIPLKAPPIIQKWIGTDVVQVVEEQQYEWSEGTLLLHSQPKPQITGKETFLTEVQFRVSDLGSNGSKSCQVIARVTCTAVGMWPVVSTIERAMIEQAHDSTASWLRFCRNYCSSKLQANKGSSPQGRLRDGLDSLVADDLEVFRDACDEPEDEAQEDRMGAWVSQREALLLPPHSGMEYGDAVLMYLNNLTDITHQQCRYMEQFGGRLERLETCMEHMCTILRQEQEHRVRQRAAAARWQGLAIGTGLMGLAASLVVVGLALYQRRL